MRQEKVDSILNIAFGVILVIFGILQFSYFYKARHNIVLFSILIISLFIVSLMISYRRKDCIKRKIIIIIGICLFFLMLLKTNRIYIISSFIYLIISILFFIYEKKIGNLYKETSFLILIFNTFNLINVLFEIFKITIINDFFKSNIFYIILVLGIIIFLFFIILCIKNNKRRVKPTFKGIVSNSFLVLIVIFTSMFFSYILVNCINYTFDFTAPSFIKALVIEKDHNTGKYSHFDLTLKYNDEKIEIRVTEKMYNEVDVGDYISIPINKGLFNENYYHEESYYIF